jgi:hypothetical protein
MMEKISSGNPADRGWRAAAVILFPNVSNDPVSSIRRLCLPPFPVNLFP